VVSDTALKNMNTVTKNTAKIINFSFNPSLLLINDNIFILYYYRNFLSHVMIYNIGILFLGRDVNGKEK
jgi:hypothetical protein